MPEEKLQEIADNADMIVRGYAFTKKGGNIAVLNLYHPESAMYISPDGKILSLGRMDDVKQCTTDIEYRKLSPEKQEAMLKNMKRLAE